MLWCIFSNGISLYFVCCMLCSVTQVTLFIKRHLKLCNISLVKAHRKLRGSAETLQQTVGFTLFIRLKIWLGRRGTKEEKECYILICYCYRLWQTTSFRVKSDSRKNVTSWFVIVTDCDRQLPQSEEWQQWQQCLCSGRLRWYCYRNCDSLPCTAQVWDVCVTAGRMRYSVCVRVCVCVCVCVQIVTDNFLRVKSDERVCVELYWSVYWWGQWLRVAMEYSWKACCVVQISITDIHFSDSFLIHITKDFLLLFVC